MNGICMHALSFFLLLSAFGSSNWLDKIIEINHKSKTWLLQRIRGGLLDSGFTALESGYQIIKEEDYSCVIRAVTSFKVKPESISNASSLQPSWRTAIAVAIYVNSMKSTPLGKLETQSLIYNETKPCI